MADEIMPLSEAVEGYDLFDKMKAQKGKIAFENAGPSDSSVANNATVVFEAQK